MRFVTALPLLALIGCAHADTSRTLASELVRLPAASPAPAMQVNQIRMSPQDMATLRESQKEYLQEDESTEGEEQ